MRGRSPGLAGLRAGGPTPRRRGARPAARWGSLALALALLLAAARARSEEQGGAAGAVPAAPAAPPREVVVRAIRFHGTHALTPEAIEPYLFTRARPAWKLWAPRPSLDPTALDSDMQRIVALYRERGYYETRASYTIEWNEARDQARVEIRVEEGAPVVLESWGVELSELPGDEGEWRRTLLQRLPLRDGAIFDLDTYTTARRMLLDGLADRGFPDATLSGGADVDLATHRALVWWRVHPGASVRFGSVRIEGLDGRSEALVRGELTVAPGEPYSQRELERSQQRIAELGLFRSVLLKPLSSAGDEDLSAERERSMSLTPETTLERPILVQLEGRPLHSVKLGLGYGTEDRVRVQAGWLHRDLLGRADRLQLTGRYSSLLSEFSAELREPRVPDRDTTLLVSSSLRREEVPAYDAVELTGGVFLERALRRGWSWRAGYTAEWSDVRDVPDAARALLLDPERRTLVSAFQLALRRITTDDLLDPHRGTWLELAVEPSARWIGSDVDYLRATFDARGFLPLGPTVLAARAYLGTIDAFGGTQEAELPVTKLFYAGGSTSVRGYGFQRLGPLHAKGKPVGGASVATGSLELRVPLWRSLGGVAFVDAGELAEGAWKWRPGELLYAAGVGLRVRTPLGPVRVDLGVPLNPPPHTQSWRVWLSIGHAF